MPKPIEYEASTGEVRAVYDDIRATRKTDFINNFWKVIAHHPSTLSRIWDRSSALWCVPPRSTR
jgi:hypothetical protein